jgi:hypothetical protein
VICVIATLILLGFTVWIVTTSPPQMTIFLIIMFVLFGLLRMRLLLIEYFEDSRASSRCPFLFHKTGSNIVPPGEQASARFE